ncbi:glycine receptor subunit alpha-2-like [Glandiceps talaboti]
MITQRNVSGTSQFVDDILVDYDRRMRPNFNGDPVIVTVDMFISRIDNIAEVTMDFDSTLFLRQSWNDPRLVHNKSVINIPPSGFILDKIWVPDLFFFNEKKSYFHDITTDNILVRFGANGDVLYSMRISVKVSCAMDFSRFPMDRQYCGMQLESYGYTTDELIFLWKSGIPLQLPEHIKRMQQYYVSDTTLTRCDKLYYTGNFSCVEVNFTFVRLLGYYWISYFIPTLLLVILSWVSFWINPMASPARVALGVTIVLTVTTQAISVHSILPKVSYITAIDVWMLACLMFVVASLLEYSVVHHLISLEDHNMIGLFQQVLRKLTGRKPVAQKLYQEQTELQTLNSNACTASTLELDPEKQKIARKRELRGLIVDRWSRLLFPLAFLLFNIVYWSTSLTGDKRHIDDDI